jgi:Raf kinase inhibitor-like YbhB/YbcL family protein
MKVWLWVIIGLGVFFLASVLAAALRSRAGRQAEAAFHRDLPRALELRSPVFEHKGPMPATLSCEGAGGSPSLAWANVPEGTRSFALIVVDPDIPSPSTQWIEFVHWIVYDLPGKSRALPAQLSSEAISQSGAVAGRNGYGAREYVSPCPVSGTHRYLYRLYALDVESLLPENEGKRGVLDAIQGHVLAYGELWGTYKCQTLSFWGAMGRNMRRGE